MHIFLSRQFLVFVAFGLLAAAVHWLFRFGLSFVVPYVPALVIAYAMSLATGFLLTKYCVFPLSTKSTAHQASYFVLFHFSMFPIVLGISYGLSELIQNQYFAPDLARGLAHALAVITPAFINFVLQKFIAFDA